MSWFLYFCSRDTHISELEPYKCAATSVDADADGNEKTALVDGKEISCDARVEPEVVPIKVNEDGSLLIRMVHDSSLTKTLVADYLW